jgi:hypothetical protein
MNGVSADHVQDPRGALDLMLIWTVLGVTPEGCGTGWYPKLKYRKNRPKSGLTSPVLKRGNPALTMPNICPDLIRI